MAIQRYNDWRDKEPGLAANAIALLPEVSQWLNSLNRQQDLYHASDKDEPPYFSDHLDATEALLTLSTVKIEGVNIEGVNNSAIGALKQLIQAADNGKLDELNRRRTYHIAITGRDGYLAYDKRTTHGTYLATLSQGVEILTGNENATLREQTRKHCHRVLRDLTSKRRNKAGLWPAESLQFHSTLSSIEAILRYSHYVPRREISSSEEEIIQAADLLLSDEEFIKLFREKMLEKIEQLSSGSLEFDDKGKGSDDWDGGLQMKVAFYSYKGGVKSCR